MWCMEPMPGDIVLARKIVKEQHEHDMFGEAVRDRFHAKYEARLHATVGEIIFRRRFGLPPPERESYDKSDAILGNFRIDVKTLMQGSHGKPLPEYQNNIKATQMGTVNTLVVFLRFVVPENVFWMCGWSSKARIRQLGSIKAKNDTLDNGKKCLEPMFQIMNADLHHMGILWYFCNNHKPPGGLIEWDAWNTEHRGTHYASIRTHDKGD